MPQQNLLRAPEQAKFNKRERECQSLAPSQCSQAYRQLTQTWYPTPNTSIPEACIVCSAWLGEVTWVARHQVSLPTLFNIL